MLPPVARRQVDWFLSRVDRLLPGLVTGAWVGGSIALGDYHPHSDVDLLVATTRALTAEERRRASIRGADVMWTSPEVPLDGLLAVTSATIHRHGISVRGAPATDVPDVEHSKLATIVRANLRAYWIPWLASARGRLLQHLACLHPRRVEWGVFGVPRQIVTITDGRIVSKTAGVLHVRSLVDARWHPILDDAVRTRRGEHTHYASRFVRRRDMLGFVAHAIEVALQL